MTSPPDSDFMRQALVQAALVVDRVYPYPGVGVILAHGIHVIARANNGEPGQPHAEVKAISMAQKDGWPLSECVLFTNLEPCDNVGLQQACSRTIIDSGIKEVHVAVRDPYHLVRGQGIARLQEAGVGVVYGEYEEQARWQNHRYFRRFCPKCGWPIADGKDEYHRE